MAGIKRKQASSSIANGHETGKKLKKESPPPSDLEAETDSDPIIESDTTEHSGDDDGVSWPSDEDQNAEKDKKDQQATNQEGAQHLGRKSNGEEKVVKSKIANNASNTTNVGRFIGTITDIGNSIVFERSSCKAKGPRSGAQSIEA